MQSSIMVQQFCEKKTKVHPSFFKPKKKEIYDIVCLYCFDTSSHKPFPFSAETDATYEFAMDLCR